MKTLPTLYKKTSTGALQEWTIGVEVNNIITIYGQTDGKLQRTEDLIKSGKNLGKSNETSAAEQALAEATAKWEGKIKKGYVEDSNRAEAGEKDFEGGYDCMLAHKFADHGHKIAYPAYIQPKLNGHRCLAVIENGVATLWSRTRKPITSMPHIIKELQLLYPTGSHKIDGELYNHAYKDKFEELASIIRQVTPLSNCTEVRYHIYDKVVECAGFNKRTLELYGNFHGYEKAIAQLDYLVRVETILVKDEEEMMETFESFLKRGYEGGMARNVNGQYEGKRSYHLQKIKEFQDDEFPIIGIEEGRGGYAGCGIFICKAKNGKPFSVKMRGPKERLAAFLEDHSLWKNKSLTVKYQYISVYGIPIFPVGERFKESE
jgi:DNA ligase-1